MKMRRYDKDGWIYITVAKDSTGYCAESDRRISKGEVIGYDSRSGDIFCAESSQVADICDRGVSVECPDTDFDW